MNGENNQDKLLKKYKEALKLLLVLSIGFPVLVFCIYGFDHVGAFACVAAVAAIHSAIELYRTRKL